MAISPDEGWYRDEVPLRPATNIIIGPNKKYAFATKEARSEQLLDYLNLTEELLSQSVSFVVDGTGASVQRHPYFSLKSIEFYWEFNSDDPITFVNSIRDTASQFTSDFAEDNYNLPDSELRTQNQSPCLTLRLTRFIKIKIYAKTTRRVRFEVCMEGDAINIAAGPRSSLSTTEVAALVPLLADDAASRLRPLISAITATPPEAGFATPISLIHAIVQAAREPHIAQAIVSGLVTQGSISPYANDPLLVAIHRLRDRGILRTLQPKSRIYVITQEYRAALERLRTLQ